MENKNNELKIELYPDREPRYEFPKSPIKKNISKDVLSHSLDENKELAFLNVNAPILNGFYIAHSNHYPIRIKPDDIWLLIVQAFSHHVNINSEKLRNMFVNFEGKKVLESFSEQINVKMKEFLWR